MTEQQKPLLRRSRNTEASNNSERPKQKQQNEPKQPSNPLVKFLKIVWLPALLLFCLIVGSMIGYSVFGEKEVNKGNGNDHKERPAFEVLKPSTWKHMWDLVFDID